MEAGDFEHIETVVIGAGQAGLATGYHLAKLGRSFVILDGNERIGDNWRCHYDSLRLYSMAMGNRLPGMRFPAKPTSFPTKDEMAAFLERYAERFDLPVRTGVTVRRVTRTNGSYLVQSNGRSIVCANLVVATGSFGRTPYVPEFANELDPGIRHLHSIDYRNPEQLNPGPVLVVGASHSGSDIAHEAAAAGHRTYLSGHIRGEVPFDIAGAPAKVIMPVMLLLAGQVLTIRTPLGRKLRPAVRAHGVPLLRFRRAELRRAGVEVDLERTVGVRDGLPVLGDGRVVDATNVIWCTGFRQDFGWLDSPVDDQGWPVEVRGVVPSSPGLYFVGLAFQYAFVSMLVGGVGRDAKYVAKHIASRPQRS